MSTWDYMVANAPLLLQQTGQHLTLVGVSTLVAAVVALPLGIYMTLHDVLADIVLYLAGIMMTIPSIVLFGLMMPLLSTINQGIGPVPAILALILYAQMPILRNTYVAIRGVDAALVDAACGMGMTPLQVLLRVQIPIAMPLIIAGVRTAVIINTAIAAVAAYIAAGGLGTTISQGIATTNLAMASSGAVAVGVLAVVLDLALGRLQKRLVPRGLQ